ncbi:MAG: 4Fe-4S binding protein [bacterium]|nr:4Fe-4S binding protein [bacterium]
MAYVIVDTCTKDRICVDVCPVDCIKEGVFTEKPSRADRSGENWMGQRLQLPLRVHLAFLCCDLNHGTAPEYQIR